VAILIDIPINSMVELPFLHNLIYILSLTSFKLKHCSLSFMAWMFWENEVSLLFTRNFLLWGLPDIFSGLHWGDVFSARVLHMWYNLLLGVPHLKARYVRLLLVGDGDCDHQSRCSQGTIWFFIA
jgi:hypothetical protein